VVVASGGDDGTIGMTAIAGELKNIQEQEMAGALGSAVMGGAEKAINQGVEARTVEMEPAEPANVTVCGSGNIAQVYFDLFPRKITLNELNSAYPGMVEALVQHEGVGFVGTYDDEGVPIVLGKNGSRNLHTGEVNGEDPLEPYGDVDLRAVQVRRIADEFLLRQSERIGIQDSGHLGLVRLEMELLDKLRSIYTLAKRIAKDFVPDEVASKA